MELLTPIELDLDTLDWTRRFSNRDVWQVLNAARDGDIVTLRDMIASVPSIVDAQFWYTSPLHFAVREGHTEAVKILVENGADITLQSLYGNETFFQTATERGHEEVADFLAETMRRRMESEGVDHPVHEFARGGNVKRVREILSKDPSLANRGDRLGRRPLHYAVEGQHTKLISFLLQNGSEVDAVGFSSDDRVGGYGFRPVTLALWHHPYWRQRNDYETAQLLLDNGSEYTPTIAAALGDISRIRELLRIDRSLANFEESGGKRPLSAAAERNHIEIVRELLDAGADPNLAEGPNCPQGFALWAATRHGYREIAEMLLEAGADANADVESSGNPTESAGSSEMRTLCYRYGGVVRLFAHFHQGNVDVIAAVLKHAPEVFTEQVAADAFTACVSSGHGDIVELLLAHGIRVPAQVTGCQTYLWQKLELTKRLLDFGMDPNLPNWQQIRPLHFLGRSGNIEGARLFLEYGADPFLIDEEYQTTPLGWAAMFGQTDFVRFLIHEVPGVRTVSADVPAWSTPLEWAKRRGHPETAELL